METVKERINAFLNYKQINTFTFEKKTGASNGYWRKSKSADADFLSRVKEVFPTINIEWVITGVGNMEITPSSASSICVTGVDAVGRDDMSTRKTIIKTETHTDAELYKAVISELKEQIAFLRQQLDAKDKLITQLLSR